MRSAACHSSGMGRSMRRAWRRGGLPLLAVAAFVALPMACGGDDGPTAGGSTAGTAGTGGRPEGTGQACTSPTDCYGTLDGAAVHGDVQCLDGVEDGYCTHLCETDADCCALAGECKDGIEQVCSPFRSTGLMLCFLSCEDADLRPAAGVDASVKVDADEYCAREASADFHCSSTGGGSDNRKVCLPGGGSGGAGGSGANDAGGA